MFEHTYYVITDGTLFLYCQDGTYYSISGFELKCLFKDPTSFERRHIFNNRNDIDKAWVVVPARIAIEWDE